MTQPEGADRSRGDLAPVTGRRLSIIALIVIIVVYLAIVQGLSYLLTTDLDVTYVAPTSVTELWRSITVPVAASLLFV
jgi:uncharacterized protein